MPKELWNEDGISYAISLIGELYSMYEITTTMTRLDYARVCVFIIAGQDVKILVPVNIRRETIFKDNYEWLPLMCKTCKIFGHSTEDRNRKQQNYG